MRGVSADFVLAMAEKLSAGRVKGRQGWDSHWKVSSIDDFDIKMLMEKLDEEVLELDDALAEGTLGELRLECADVANVVMMIADMAGALKDE